MASFDEEINKWVVKARNLCAGELKEYCGRFSVVASGGTSDPYTPEVEGLNTFNGDVLHSTLYENGKGYSGKNVLVVGAGNFGIEIALDLADHGAKTSIVVRSPVQVLSRKMAYLAMVMLKYFPASIVDSLMMMLSQLGYGDLTKYGICRPNLAAHRKPTIVDVGTLSKIKSGEIQVLPALSSIRGNEVLFENGKTDYLLNEEGFAKNSFPNNWKGKNGLYCVGLSMRGFTGSSFDAQHVAHDIKSLL